MPDMRCYLGEGHTSMGGLLLGFERRTRDGAVEEAIRGDQGQLEWTVIEDLGVWRPPLLRLSHWEGQAFWDAVSAYRDPPTESKALREALAIERGRVDLILGRSLAGEGIHD